MICHGQIILLTLPTKLTRSLVCSVGLFATTIAQVLRKGSMYHLLDLYCSQIWRPYLRKDIKLVQRRATKFILNDYSLDYKSRLLKLNLLPLTMLYIYDICFFVKSLKQPSTSFNITDFVSFSHNSNRSGSHLKLVHQLAKANRYNQFYFTRLLRLWNALPTMDLSKSYITIVNNIKRIFWEYFVCNFDQSNICTFHFFCPCSRCHNVTTCTFRIKSDQS